MSLAEQSDDKDHSSPRYGTKNHLCPPLSQPDATGFSAVEPDAIQPRRLSFAEDFIGQHSSLGTAFVQGYPLISSIRHAGARNIQKRATVKLHSVFLRSGCILPDRVDPCLQPIGKEWSVVEEIPALAFDTMVRRAGWHFMWLQEACSRRGIGLTEEVAIHRALSRALKGVSNRFNAAELDSVQITQYPGFQIANVTVLTLQIQQHASLKIPAGLHPQPVPAR